MAEYSGTKRIPVSTIFKMITMSENIPDENGRLIGQLCYVKSENKWYFWNNAAWEKITSEVPL